MQEIEPIREKKESKKERTNTMLQISTGNRHERRESTRAKEKRELGKNYNTTITRADRMTKNKL